MFRLEFLFLMQCATGILILMLLHRINQMKKQMDAVIREVNDYVSFITSEEITKSGDEVKAEKVNFFETGKEDTRVTNMQQNRIIQDVLSEYFP